MANKQSNLKFIQTIKNIWKVEDLRVRIGITLLFVAIYRFGSQIVLPGIDTVALIEGSKLADQTKGGLMSLLDMLYHYLSSVINPFMGLVLSMLLFVLVVGVFFTAIDEYHDRDW